jgi:PAS domain S-box-containing protein
MPETRSLDLDQTLARTGDGAFVIGADGRIVLWNRAAEKIMGHAAGETIGRPCCEVFIGLDGDGNRLCYQGCHVMNLVRLSEPIHSFDMQTRTKAGKPVWINVSILATPANGKTGPLTIHLFRDVTASKELLRLVQDRLRPPDTDGSSPATLLTRRELEVLRLMTLGVSTALAAERLHVSRATVRNHVQNIFGKLGVHSRLEAVALANKHRLL